ncbi:hypothetical protein V5799_001119, partial [Amblyomma americanum]
CCSVYAGYKFSDLLLSLTPHLPCHVYSRWGECLCGWTSATATSEFSDDLARRCSWRSISRKSRLVAKPATFLAYSPSSPEMEVRVLMLPVPTVEFGLHQPAVAGSEAEVALMALPFAKGNDPNICQTILCTIAQGFTRTSWSV